MIYRSNLTCPDLTPHFKHLHSRVMGHSFGHDVPSDWADKADDDPVFGIYKRCGMWTHDEAAILYSVSWLLGFADWLDIGSHTGWTSAHILAPIYHPTLYCYCLDPMYTVAEFLLRAGQNITASGHSCQYQLDAQTSEDFFLRASFAHGIRRFRGVCIDGDHEPGKPLEDAVNAAASVTPDGIIIFHDFIGRPVQEAVEWLIEQGFKCRIYLTPHAVALCWRGNFVPPDHVPDPLIAKQLMDGRLDTFKYWGRVE
jgi:methyltransferase family protein